MLSNNLQTLQKTTHVFFYRTQNYKNDIVLVYSNYSCNYFNLFIIYIYV